MARDTLEALRRCNENLPMMMFTTCCDEVLGTATTTLKDHKLRTGIASQPINFGNIKETLDILCQNKADHVHNMFGSYTARKVKFVSNL